MLNGLLNQRNCVNFSINLKFSTYSVVLFFTSCIHYHILLWQYSPNCYIYNKVVKHPYTLPANCVESPYKYHRFASQLVEIYISVNIRPLKIFIKTPGNPMTNAMVDHQICSVPGVLLFRECWLPQLPRRQYGTLCGPISAVSHRYMQTAISNQSGHHANQYLVRNYWNIVRFSGLVFFFRCIYRKLLEFYKVPSPRSYGIFTRAVYLLKRRPCPSHYHETKETFFSVQDQVKLVR